MGIVGASGRMGQEIAALASEFSFRAVGVARSKVEGLKTVATLKELKRDEAKVIVDFSLPDLTGDVAAWCSLNKVPLVSGVTGLNQEQIAKIKDAARSVAVLWAPNMSIGVAVLARMLKKLEPLDDFEFQIEELHHKRKKDRPSGTAIYLQERLKDAVGVEVPEPLSIRGGGIFGTHRVWAMGEDEVITLEHTALNRRVFARGALKAAQWVLNQGPGLYRMDDVLGA
jgi:4-hydroxy-tetrahydrodipicolinate reductase